MPVSRCANGIAFSGLTDEGGEYLHLVSVVTVENNDLVHVSRLRKSIMYGETSATVWESLLVKNL